MVALNLPEEPVYVLLTISEGVMQQITELASDKLTGGITEWPFTITRSL
jgi:hypothetical protein